MSTGLILLLIGGSAFAVTHYLKDPKRTTPLVYSDNAMLLELWGNYKADNIEPSSGRTLDRSQGNITTSEGQSYTMLRAVWMDDKATFDKSWQFTKNNLARSDHLMSWKFGKKADGSYGVLSDIGGQNTASDADTDIALSLMMAYSRWNQASYLYEAKQIVNSIWDKEVVIIQHKPVLTADDLERKSKDNVVVNPSYFSPYSYKLFAQLDPLHDWKGLADNSYALLAELGASKLDKSSSSGLPPDWIEIDRLTGTFKPATSTNLDTNFGYDAFRIPWRLGLDYQWYKDPRAKQLLQSYSFLGKQWADKGKLATIYAHDGKVVGDYESPAAYGATLAYFKVVEPDTAKQIYNSKLLPLYSPDKQQWKSPLPYYEDNWAWFGIALYQNALPNIAIKSN